MRNLIQCVLGIFAFLITIYAFGATTYPLDTSNGYFKKDPVMGIVKTTQQACETEDHSGIGRTVWVEVVLNGYDYQECIRYYEYGLSETRSGNKVAIAYFAGDVWTSTGVVADYLKQNPQYKQDEAMSWARKLNEPYIFVARPGIYGSSGVHKGARKPLESLLMHEALNKIKQRYRIANYVLVGHSSGGHVVAALLSRRQDVICAVPSSAPASPIMRAQIKHTALPVREMDTIASLNKYTLHHPSLRVFVVGDLKDTTSPWPVQQALYNRLIQLKWTARTLNFTAKDSSHHVVADQARLIAGMCAQGHTTTYILNAAKGAQFKQ